MASPQHWLFAVSIALQQTSALTLFRYDGIPAMRTVTSRDGEHPAESRHMAREEILKYGTMDFFGREIVSTKRTELKDGHDGLEAIHG